MGFFDNLKKTLGMKVEDGSKGGTDVASQTSVDNEVQSQAVEVPASSARMVDLKKKVKVVLEKNKLTGVKARIVLLMDRSGSMSGLYACGAVQETIERLVAVASQMSTTESMDVMLFNTSVSTFPSVTEHTVDGYVREEIVRKASIGGGTSYAPAINAIVQQYGRRGATEPTLVFFITDGENDDLNQARRAIKEASHYGIFFQFVGIGNEDFRFLNELDTMEGRLIDNANFFELNDLRRISDEELYERILVEFPSWIPLAKGAGVLK